MNKTDHLLSEAKSAWNGVLGRALKTLNSLIKEIKVGLLN